MEPIGPCYFSNETYTTLAIDEGTNTVTFQYSYYRDSACTNLVKRSSIYFEFTDCSCFGGVCGRASITTGPPSTPGTLIT